MEDHSKRKTDHLDLTISGDVGFHRTTLLEQVELVHDALPELATSDIDLSGRLFGRIVKSPVVIASMTGGTERAESINRALAEVAEERGHAIGLGSQRPMVQGGVIDQVIAKSYSVRDVARSVPILGNIGLVQAGRLSTALLEELVGVVDADALCVHLNVAQEMIQPGGDRDFKGGLDTLRRLTAELSVPIIAKETGSGISRSVAQRLASVGVRHVDVSGAGGTSWVAVEAQRADGDAVRQGREFRNWGIPTAASVLQVHATRTMHTILATGGIQTGLDVARAIALGATACGMARPLLQALDAGGTGGLRRRLEEIDSDLRVAMLLSGSANLTALGRAPRVLGPDLRAWRDV